MNMYWGLQWDEIVLTKDAEAPTPCSSRTDLVMSASTESGTETFTTSALDSVDVLSLHREMALMSEGWKCASSNPDCMPQV